MWPAAQLGDPLLIADLKTSSIEDMQVPLYQAKAEFFRMLGHPVRIRVLELLGEGPRQVRELLDDIGGEASSLSQLAFAATRDAVLYRPMAIIVEVPPDAPRQAAATRVVLGPTVTRGRLACLTIAAMLTLLFLMLSDELPLLLMAAVVTPFLIVSVVMRPILVRSTLRANAKTLSRTCRMQLTDQGLDSTGEDSSSSYRWSAFTHAYELPGQVVLMLNNLLYLRIPTHGLADDDRAQLRGWLAQANIPLTQKH